MLPSLQRRILLAVGLTIQAPSGSRLRRAPSRHRNRRESFSTVFVADLVGKLNRIGVDLAFLNGLLAVGLAVEADDLDPVGFAGFLDGGDRPQRRGIVDGEDAGQIGVRLQGVFGAL